MADAKKETIGEVLLKDVRLSFEHVFEPQEGIVDKKTGIKGEDRYSASFLFPKNTPHGKSVLAAVQAAMAQVRKAKWGDNQPKLKPNQLCLRDGNLEDWDGYDGNYFVSSSRPAKGTPPVVVDRDRTPLKGTEGKIYSGCFVNAIVRVWAQDDKDYGKRINASLEAVQFVRHGDAFGPRPVDPNEAFEDISDEFAEDIGVGGETDEEDEDLLG